MEQKYYLTISDDFIQYCKLNNIDDIEKKAMEVFIQGFNVLKYGTKPIINTIKKTEVAEEKNNIIKKDDLYD